MIVLNSVIPISGSDTITVLVGNKCDLEDKREVDEADIRVGAPVIKMPVKQITCTADSGGPRP